MGGNGRYRCARRPIASFLLRLRIVARLAHPRGSATARAHSTLLELGTRDHARDARRRRAPKGSRARCQESDGTRLRLAWRIPPRCWRQQRTQRAWLGMLLRRVRSWEIRPSLCRRLRRVGSTASRPQIVRRAAPVDHRASLRVQVTKRTLERPKKGAAEPASTARYRPLPPFPA